MKHLPLRVALLSQWYAPEPVPFPHDIARALKHRGHKVNVLTGYPNYPTGALYSGYRQHFGYTEYLDGVRINRQPILANHAASAFGRAANYLSFSVSASLRICHLRGADVVFIYGTPLTAALPALLAHRTHGLPYVLQVQDLWPDTIFASGMLPRSAPAQALAARIHHLARYTYQNAAAVIGISGRMTRELVSRGADPTTAHTIYNWSPQEADTFSTSPTRRRVTRFVYAGNLGEMQDLQTVIRAARLAEDYCHLEVLIIGEGVMEDRLKRLVTSLDARSVSFIGRIPPNEMGDHYAQSDFSLVTLLDRPLFTLTVPSKVQASLAHGVPIVTTVRGEVSDLCVRYQFGLTARPQDPQSLADAMRRAATLSLDARARMRQNARSAYVSLFTRDAAMTQIESILRLASKEPVSNG